ncbi:MAG: hypothetical protein IJR80_08690 [Treponema sp.]|nr:hypothetical protein [Treponema sp.]
MTAGELSSVVELFEPAGSILTAPPVKLSQEVKIRHAKKRAEKRALAAFCPPPKQIYRFFTFYHKESLFPVFSFIHCILAYSSIFIQEEAPERK